MHDQIKDLGRAIVQEESFNNLGKHSRLWIQEEAWEVLNEQQGTNEVEALSLLQGEDFEDYCLASEQFEDLTKLRLLHLECATLNGDFSNLLTNLKWLQWSECCSEFMPTNFHPRKLVVLDLEKSPITEQWSGWSQQELVKKLKVVKLKLCSKLSTTPDFSAFKKLEILILSRLESLNKIEGSIGSVCKTLVTLDVSHCQKLEEIPRQVGELEKLKRLIVDGTTIREIPISGRMMELQVLSAIGCKQLLEIPEIIGSLLNLHTISLTLCSSLKKIPESIGNLGGLSKLDVSHTKLIELPESIGDLQNLKEFNISYSQIERLPPGIDESNVPRFIACASAYVQKRQRDSGLRVIPGGDVLRRPACRT